jgi:hypothetical protein
MINLDFVNGNRATPAESFELEETFSVYIEIAGPFKENGGCKEADRPPQAPFQEM